MNDDELGRAVGTALGAPQVQAAPRAGAALRARAGRQRVRRGALAVATAGVVAALAVGLVRWSPGPATSTAAGQGASAGSGRLFLSTPFSVGPPVTCAAPGARCTRPLPLTVDEILAVRAEGAAVVVDLTAADAATLAGLVASRPGAPLDVRVGTGPVRRARLDQAQVRIRAAGPAAAAATVADLEPYRPGPPRTGPGPLGVPLELWSVASATAGPCRGPAVPDARLVERPGECQVLRGPGVSLRSADLRVAPPDTGTAVWRVVVGVPAEDRAALEAWSRGQVDERIAYVAGRAVVAGSPLVLGALSHTVEIPAEDRAGAEALVSRLRP